MAIIQTFNTTRIINAEFAPIISNGATTIAGTNQIRLTDIDAEIAKVARGGDYIIDLANLEVRTLVGGPVYSPAPLILYVDVQFTNPLAESSLRWVKRSGRMSGFGLANPMIFTCGDSLYEKHNIMSYLAGSGGSGGIVSVPEIVTSASPLTGAAPSGAVFGIDTSSNTLYKVVAGVWTILPFIGDSLALMAVQTANFTAMPGNRYPLDSSGGAFTITLQATPAVDSIIEIFDAVGEAENTPISIQILAGTNYYSGNASPATDSLNLAGGLMRFRYISSSIGYVREN